MSGNQIASISGPSGPRHIEPDDLVLYAMQFLTGEDAANIAQHVGDCAECLNELTRVHGDLAACSLSVDLAAPPALSRQRLMKQVAREKKVVSISQPAAAPVVAIARSGTVSSIEAREPRRSLGRSVLAWSGWAVAASLAVAVSSLYRERAALRDTLASRTGQVERLTASVASAHQLMDALTDPRAVRVTLTTKPLPKPGPIGGVTYNPGKGSLIFLASELDPLQLYKTYELWLIPSDGSAPIPAGTFHPDDQGNASVIMPDLPKGVAAKAFGVTIEADGGAQSPTLPIIMAGS